ncbi:hypothetical protein HC891_26700 [Candidatus Gracilibacteria bacterium]|nr:hypothetical protein [Candidatus Gracilibacteria bacterium]
MSDEDLIRLLRSVLATKRILLILDNVAGRDFEPSSLLSNGSPSKILLTTADRDLAAVAANTAVDLQPLNEEAARVLLRRVAGDELLTLPGEVLDRLLRLTGRLPQLLVIVGREARLVKRRGQEVLERWASNLKIDTGDLQSIYEFIWHQLSESEHRVVAVLGALAETRFNDALIAAMLQSSLEDTREWLSGLESRSLLQRISSSDFQAHSSVHRFAVDQWANFEERDQVLADATNYLVSFLSNASDTDSRYEPYALHLESLFEWYIRESDWASVRLLLNSGLRFIRVSGRMSILAKTNWFLAQWNGLNAANAILSDSLLRGLQANDCNFAEATLVKLKCEGTQFNDCNFAGVSLVDIDLRGTQFNDCNFAGASLVDLDLRGTQFNDCNFASARLASVDLRDAQFNDCNLTGIYVVQADLRGAKFAHSPWIEYVFVNVHLDETPPPDAP